MATHSIGAGTANFSLNLRKELRGEMGRLATMEGARSVNAWLREIVEEKVAAAKLRGALDTAGQLALRLPAVALGLLGVAAMLAHMFAVDSDLVARRVAGRRTGRRRDEIELITEC